MGVSEIRVKRIRVNQGLGVDRSTARDFTVEVTQGDMGWFWAHWQH